MHQSQFERASRKAGFLPGVCSVFASAIGYGNVQEQERFTGTLTIFAAVSLTGPFTEIGRRFEAAHLQTISIKSPSLPIACTKEARNMAAARAFATFVRSIEGQAIFKAHHYPSVNGGCLQ